MTELESKIANTKAPVIFIMGPTASGKTALAMNLFKTQQFEIISVDSAMVFKQMDIGSAKPSDKELKQAPHFLIDFIDPKNAYSASDFRNDAINLINEIHARGKVPLLVGGTMLYFKALKDGLAKLPHTDEQVRAKLQVELKENGVEALHQQLEKVDPVTADKLHSTDTQRVCRALEVYKLSGKPISQWHAEQKLDALPNPLLSIALAPKDRALLHKRIEQRFTQMLQDGFIKEVTALYKRGDLTIDNTSMRCVGYRQFWQFLDGELSLNEATERAIIATRQLAKRQYTWLRSWPDAEWYDPLDEAESEEVEKRILAFSQTA